MYHEKQFQKVSKYINHLIKASCFLTSFEKFSCLRLFSFVFFFPKQLFRKYLEIFYSSFNNEILKKIFFIQIKTGIYR